jgi:MFS family permease
MKLFSSIIYVAGAISVFAMGFVSDWLVKKRGLKFGRRLIGISFPCIAAIIFFSLAYMDNNTIAVVGLFTAYLFVGSAPGTSFSTCIDIGCNNVGAVAGMMNTVGQSAGFAIGLVVGRLVQITHSYTSSLFVIAGVLIGGAMMWLLVDPTKKIAKEDKVVKLEDAVFA